eukprot:COSAG01_NODE_12288_length_1765_cov_11.675429_3_plen_144_part_01
MQLLCLRAVGDTDKCSLGIAAANTHSILFDDGATRKISLQRSGNKKRPFQVREDSYQVTDWDVTEQDAAAGSAGGGSSSPASPNVQPDSEFCVEFTEPGSIGIDLRETENGQNVEVGALKLGTQAMQHRDQLFEGLILTGIGTE